jgi:LPXTG-motif cell wall-anchored protein
LLGAAIVFACTALTTGVGTAARAETAADPSIVFSMPTDVQLPIGGVPRTVEAHSTTANVVGPEVVFHTEDLGNVATIDFPDDCATTAESPETVTCPLPDSGEHPFPLLVTPAATGTAGATGKLHMTVQAPASDYGPWILPDLIFTLSDSADLTIAEFADGGTVQPEQQLQVPAPAVTNLGNKEATGIRVRFGFDDPTLVPQRYTDCTYTDTEATCDVLLAEPLLPGEGVTLWPYEFTTTADALGKKSVWVTVEALDEPDAAAALSKATATATTGARWAGGAAAKSAQRAGAAAQEANADDNSAEFAFVVENTYDIEALGATATGAVNVEVKVVIGARNNGPGTLDETRGQAYAWWFYFAVPPGTEVVGVPDRCAGKVVDGDSSEYVDGRAGVTLYRCHHEAFRFPVETSTTVEFTLKITEVTADATGKVSWSDPDDTTTQPPADTNTENDTADVVINASAGGGGGGGNGGTNGGLPITGTNSVALAGVGFGLVLAGSALYFVSRRRRSDAAEAE